MLLIVISLLVAVDVIVLIIGTAIPETRLTAQAHFDSEKITVSGTI